MEHRIGPRRLGLAVFQAARGPLSFRVRVPYYRKEDRIYPDLYEEGRPGCWYHLDVFRNKGSKMSILVR
jgi:hypothetical protein